MNMPRRLRRVSDVYVLSFSGSSKEYKRNVYTNLLKDRAFPRRGCSYRRCSYIYSNGSTSAYPSGSRNFVLFIIIWYVSHRRAWRVFSRRVKTLPGILQNVDESSRGSKPSPGIALAYRDHVFALRSSSWLSVVQKESSRWRKKEKKIEQRQHVIITLFAGALAGIAHGYVKNVLLLWFVCFYWSQSTCVCIIYCRYSLSVDYTFVTNRCMWNQKQAMYSPRLKL